MAQFRHRHSITDLAGDEVDGVSNLEPPPSLLELVKDDPAADAQWKKWLNVFYEYIGTLNKAIQDNMSKDLGIEIPAGTVDGYSSINKFGFAPDFDTGDNEITIWDGADDGNANKMVYTYSTTADITDIVSSSASDTFEVEVQGLDTNWESVTQTKTLTGTTSVALDTALIRVFRLKNNSSSVAVGKIQCGVGSASTNFSTANLRAEIAIGREQTLMSIYTVPSGKTAYMTGWFFYTAGTNKSADYNITIMARPSGGVFQIKHHGSILDGASNEVSHKYMPYNKFTEKTDIESRAQITAVGVVAAGISAGFDLILVDN